MKKLIMLLVLVIVAMISIAANRTGYITTGKTTLSAPMSFGATDTLGTSETVTIIITNSQQYAQMQNMYTTLTTVSGTPSVAIKLWGKCFSGDAYVQIGSTQTWTSTGNNPVNITSTTPNQYQYLKAEYVCSAAAQEVKITAFDLKTWFTGGVASSGTLTDGTLTINSGAISGATTADFSGAVTMGSTLDVTGKVSSDNGVDLGTSKSLTGTTGLTIGAGTETVAINSSDWDIDATGIMTGIGTISSGKLSSSGGVDLGTSQSLTGTTAMTIGQGTETININSSDWKVDATGVGTGFGNFTSNGDATFTGGDFTGAAGNYVDIGEVADGTFTLGRDDAGTVTLTTSDNDANADFLIAAGGTGGLTLGDNASTTAISSSDWTVDATGIMANMGTYNGQTISATASLTGTLGTAGAITATRDGDNVILNPYDDLHAIDVQINSASKFNVDTTGKVSVAAGLDLGTSQALTGTTALTIGDNAQTIAVNSSDWDIDATGIASNMGTYNSQTISATANFTGSLTTGGAVSVVADGDSIILNAYQELHPIDIRVGGQSKACIDSAGNIQADGSLALTGTTSGGITVAPIATGTGIATIQNQNVSNSTITLPSATCTLPGLSLGNAWSGANTFAGGTSVVPFKLGTKSNSADAGLILVGSTDNTGGIQLFCDDGGDAVSDITSPLWPRYMLTAAQSSGATQTGLYAQLKTKDASTTFTGGSITALKAFNQAGVVVLASGAEFGIINAGTTVLGEMTVATGTRFSGVDINIGGVGPITPAGTGVGAGLVIRNKGEGAIWPVDISLQYGETISNTTDGVIDVGAANVRAATYNFADATAVDGTGDAITMDFVPNLAGLVAGLTVTFVAEASNSGAATLAIDGGTAKAINEAADNSALEANDIRSGSVVTLVYDGTQWQQTSQSGN